MKKLGVIVAAVLIGLVLALVVLRIVGLDPKGRRAGLWLTGDLVTEPVTDWSFTDRTPTILVETRTWYGIPHSVTIGCTAHNGQLYLTAVYPPGGHFPRDKAWNRNVMRDPHVRLKIGNRVFDRTVTLVTDPTEKDAVLQTKAKKYPAQRVPDKRNVYVFHVLPG
jgi:F420H(2)-dependent quinone reductase